MTERILITSFKGGVGKTTVAANLGAALAARGKRVCVCDCDLESRCLDIVAGLTDLPLYNICDALRGECELSDAIAEIENGTLGFITAPAVFPDEKAKNGEVFTEEQVIRFIDGLSERYDYILFDLPARPDALYKLLCAHTDLFLVVSLHTATAIRAAEKTADTIRTLLGEDANPDIRLVVNGFKPTDVKSSDNVGLYDILSRTHLPLAGVIPYDAAMGREQEKGFPAYKAKNGRLPFYKAIVNTASRIEGLAVPLLRGIRTGIRSKDLL